MRLFVLISKFKIESLDLVIYEIEKGKSFLRKDNILDEEIAKEKEDDEKMNLIIDTSLNQLKKDLDLVCKNSDNIIEKINNNFLSLENILESIENKIKLL